MRCESVSVPTAGFGPQADALRVLLAEHEATAAE
jgi:hypothetical protein